MAFLLQKIAEKEDIKVSQEEVAHASSTWPPLYQIPAEKFLKDLQKRNGIVEIYDQVMNEKDHRFPAAERENRGRRTRSAQDAEAEATPRANSFRRQALGTPLLAAAELFLQLAVIHLDQCRPAMRAGVGHGATAQIVHQILQFRPGQRIVGFHRVAANGLGDGVLAQPQAVHFLPGGFEFIHQFKHEPPRVGRP